MMRRAVANPPQEVVRDPPSNQTLGVAKRAHSPCLSTKETGHGSRSRTRSRQASTATPVEQRQARRCETTAPAEPRLRAGLCLPPNLSMVEIRCKRGRGSLKGGQAFSCIREDRHGLLRCPLVYSNDRAAYCRGAARPIVSRNTLNNWFYWRPILEFVALSW
jgi:hypothetical protein